MRLPSDPTVSSLVVVPGSTARRSVVQTLSAARRWLTMSLVLAAALTSSLPVAAASQSERWPERLPTPASALTSVEGEPVAVSAWRGKVVLLNFWASWCEPCVSEFPALSALASGEAAGRGLLVVGINYKESARAVTEFRERHGGSFPVYLDKSGEALRQWTRGMLPTTILIGRDGRARWRITGELDTADPVFLRRLESLLRENPAADAAGRIIVK